MRRRGVFRFPATMPKWCAARGSGCAFRSRGQPVAEQAEGLLAVAFQHEIDHLDGILFVDRLSPLKRGLFRKKYQKILEQRQEQL